MLACGESNKEGAHMCPGELHGFVCTAFSVVNGNRKSLLLITRSSGVYKTRSSAAQIGPGQEQSCAVCLGQRGTARSLSDLCCAMVSSGTTASKPVSVCGCLWLHRKVTARELLQ